MDVFSHTIASTHVLAIYHLKSSQKLIIPLLKKSFHRQSWSKKHIIIIRKQSRYLINQRKKYHIVIKKVRNNYLPRVKAHKSLSKSQKNIPMSPPRQKQVIPSFFQCSFFRFYRSFFAF